MPTELHALLWRAAGELAAALLCGVCLGLERERKDKPAGLRTLVLITVGAALYMLVGRILPLVVSGPHDILRPDPSRIGSGVVTGIGFLGAGSIIHSRGSVHGLTTAAVIWIAAALGVACGAGFPLEAMVVTGVVLLTLVGMSPLGRWLARRGPMRTLRLLVPDDGLTYRRLQHLVAEQEGEDLVGVLERRDRELLVEITYHTHGTAPLRLLESLGQIRGVRGLPEREQPDERR